TLAALCHHRPRLSAADAPGARPTLVEAELTKGDIREASRALGLRTWDRPASPCLSSRFPYGTRITAERLQQVAAAERWLREHGLRELRVRFHDALARVEVPPADMAAVLALRTEPVAAFRTLRFTSVPLHLLRFTPLTPLHTPP